MLLATTAKEYDYKATQQFLREVKPPMSAIQATVANGGHNFTTWAEEQGPTMIWMSAHMSPPVSETLPSAPPTPRPTHATPRPTPGRRWPAAPEPSSRRSGHGRAGGASGTGWPLLASTRAALP
ncbi:hypothetical protein GXW82_30240 [Streptacidiphilus sp. 4-A2]|nr:hypothetical protein [Streptacidiphilus sp. 4-A2]